MKKIKMVVIGAGARGNIYASYSLAQPDEMEVVAVVEILKKSRNDFSKKYRIPSEHVFSNVQDFINKRIECDLVAVTTMDKDHIWISKLLLENGYDILLEKPITANKNELLELEQLQKKTGRQVFVCHVLRYTPFYRSIKQQLLDGNIGKIISIDMSEHVGIAHFISSYDVGRWKSEKECGSSFLLAKCCHDFDIMCWLNQSDPQNVASFAGRKLFIPDNAPEGASARCEACSAEKQCFYSCYKALKKKWINDGDTEKHADELLKGEYGNCVYQNNDLFDRQNVIVQFANGSIGSFQLIGGAPKADRYIKIIGEKGEIHGSFEEGKFEVIVYDPETARTNVKQYDVNVKEKSKFIGFHNGGDHMLCHDLVRYLNGDKSSISITMLRDSVNGHLCVYAGDESAKFGKIVNIK